MTTTEENAATGSAPRVLTFSSHFPIPSPMNAKGDLVNNGEFFKQQWQDYEVAPGLKKQEQKIRLATLRSAMGKDCLQIFLNLKLSSEQQKDMHECIDALEAYFKPKWTVVYERYLFNMSQQNPDEPVDGYVNRLRKAASTCQFGTLTEELIRDRLVIGLRDHATKLRLLKEDSLDINKALNICRSSEVVTSQLKAMKSEKNKSTEQVHVISGRQNNKVKSRNQYNGKKKTRNLSSDPRKHREPNSKQTTYQCYRCRGKQTHTLENCPAFGHKCKACKKPNHFASVYRSLQKRPIKQMTNKKPTPTNFSTNSKKSHQY